MKNGHALAFDKKAEAIYRTKLKPKLEGKYKGVLWPSMSSRETTSWGKQSLRRSRRAAGNIPARFSMLFESAIRPFTRYVVHGHPRNGNRCARTRCCSGNLSKEAQDFCYHRHRFLRRVVPPPKNNSSHGFRARRQGSVRFGRRTNCAC
jgi:hypothetical protein